MYEQACEDIREQLLAQIEAPEELRIRLRHMGPQQLVKWIVEHMDEVTALISNPDSAPKRLFHQRRDLSLYAAAMACNLAQGLLVQALELEVPVSGPEPAVVADMADRALRICQRRAAPWPYGGDHPFSS